MKRVPRALLLGLLVLTLAAIAASSLAPEVSAARTCTCPDVFKPVLCDNGQAYDNACYARCDHAKNCEPIAP